MIFSKELISETNRKLAPFLRKNFNTFDNLNELKTYFFEERQRFRDLVFKQHLDAIDPSYPKSALPALCLVLYLDRKYSHYFNSFAYSLYQKTNRDLDFKEFKESLDKYLFSSSTELLLNFKITSNLTLCKNLIF